MLAVAGDRLAADDLEKLTVTTPARDRQLQEQRKRRAAAFLTKMKQEADVVQNVDDTATECASNPGANLPLFIFCVWDIFLVVDNNVMLAFNALTLLVGWQEGYPARKKLE